MAVKKNKKRSMQKSLKHSYKHKDDGISNLIIRLPKNVTFFPKLKVDKKYRLGFICYPIATKNHPLVKFSDFEVGELVYNLEVVMHRNVGIKEERVLCLKEMLGKGCPVCEEIKKQKGMGNIDVAKKLKTTKRVFYNVIDFRNLDKGIQILEQSHFTFEEPLITSARGSSDIPGEIVEFPIDPEENTITIVRFEMFEKTGGGLSFLKPGGIMFKEYTDNLPKDIFKNIVSLDKCLVIPTEEEVKALLLGDDIDDNDEEEGEAVIDDEEEEPEEKPKKKEKKECPNGHVFGKDCDEYEDDCDDCDMWGRCNKAKKGE